MKNLINYFIYIFFSNRCRSCFYNKFVEMEGSCGCQNMGMGIIYPCYGEKRCGRCSTVHDFWDYSPWWSVFYNPDNIWDRFNLVELEQSGCDIGIT